MTMLETQREFCDRANDILKQCGSGSSTAADQHWNMTWTVMGASCCSTPRDVSWSTTGRPCRTMISAESSAIIWARPDTMASHNHAPPLASLLERGFYKETRRWLKYTTLTATN